MKWNKTGRTVRGNGESTTTYESTDGAYRIESRKRKNGSGMNTSYHLIHNGQEQEYLSLRNAKLAAEKGLI